MAQTTSVTLYDAARQCCEVFCDHRDELKDLSATFWIAIGQVREAAEAVYAAPGRKVAAGEARVRQVVRALHRTLGAPGDFGYGTACGDALRTLYEATAAPTDECEWTRPQ